MLRHRRFKEIKKPDYNFDKFDSLKSDYRELDKKYSALKKSASYRYTDVDTGFSVKFYPSRHSASLNFICPTILYSGDKMDFFRTDDYGNPTGFEKSYEIRKSEDILSVVENCVSAFVAKYYPDDEDILDDAAEFLDNFENSDVYENMYEFLDLDKKVGLSRKQADDEEDRISHQIEDMYEVGDMVECYDGFYKVTKKMVDSKGFITYNLVNPETKKRIMNASWSVIRDYDVNALDSMEDYNKASKGHDTWNGDGWNTTRHRHYSK